MTRPPCDLELLSSRASQVCIALCIALSFSHNQAGKKTGWVADAKQLANISVAHSDPRFDPVVDEISPSIQTVNVLCVPIQQGDRLIGVAQACNKADGFSAHDEEVLCAL